MKMNKKKFLASLKEVYCRPGRTKYGVGVIAIRDIPKGVNPFKNCDPFGDILKIPEKEFESFPAPEEVKDLVRDFCVLQDGYYFVPDYGIDAADKSFFINHSRKPNLRVLKGGEEFVAARRIKKGEELTSDYRLYSTTKRFKV
ncbi:SET domain-containing protein [Patescibacteria group bacterium]|nr:SET domain-containing protein [Patescibacteria group bacterium]